MKKLLVSTIIILCLGCAAFPKIPSKCDNLERSYLCNIIEKVNEENGTSVRLEDVGNGLILANAVVIEEGLYTKDDAIKVMKELRAILNNPISYAFFTASVYSYNMTDKYPGLLDIAIVYFNELENVTQIMYNEDQDLLKGWLDRQISILEGG